MKKIEEKDIKSKKGMHIDIEKDLYDRIKIAAIRRGMTISRYVLGCLGDQLVRDEKYNK